MKTVAGVRARAARSLARSLARIQACDDARRSMLSRRIRLDIFDRDRGKEQGDSLGWGNFNLDLVAEGQVHEQWVQLRNVFAGELRLRVLVLSGTDDDDSVRCRRVVRVCLCVVGALRVIVCVVTFNSVAVLIVA